jgi:hypothetical protein
MKKKISLIGEGLVNWLELLTPQAMTIEETSRRDRVRRNQFVTPHRAPASSLDDGGTRRSPYWTADGLGRTNCLPHWPGIAEIVRSK